MTADESLELLIKGNNSYLNAEKMLSSMKVIGAVYDIEIGKVEWL